jgi:hypothetical protein
MAGRVALCWKGDKREPRGGLQPRRHGLNVPTATCCTARGTEGGLGLTTTAIAYRASQSVSTTVRQPANKPLYRAKTP